MSGRISGVTPIACVSVFLNGLAAENSGEGLALFAG